VRALVVMLVDLLDVSGTLMSKVCVCVCGRWLGACVVALRCGLFKWRSCGGRQRTCSVSSTRTQTHTHRLARCATWWAPTPSCSWAPRWTCCPPGAHPKTWPRGSRTQRRGAGCRCVRARVRVQRPAAAAAAAAGRVVAVWFMFQAATTIALCFRQSRKPHLRQHPAHTTPHGAPHPTQPQVTSTHLVSSRSGEGVPAVAAKIGRERRGRDVFVVGAANVGKSAFVRALLREMSRWVCAVALAAPTRGGSHVPSSRPRRPHTWALHRQPRSRRNSAAAAALPAPARPPCPRPARTCPYPPPHHHPHTHTHTA
jgi:hypothetical protein